MANMKIKILLVWSICMMCFAIHAQQPAAKKDNGCGCSFSSIIQLGLLEGSQGSAFHAQVVNGLRWNTWFAGVGVGLDRYRMRSAPLFFDLRKELSREANAPFLYADIGWNF